MLYNCYVPTYHRIFTAKIAFQMMFYQYLAFIYFNYLGKYFLVHDYGGA